MNEYILKYDDFRIRDPFIMTDKEKQEYYLVASCNTLIDEEDICGFIIYRSRDLKNWTEPKRIYRRTNGELADTKDYWAPEIYKYEGKYYVFITIKKENGYRGTYAFVSDTPDGEFKLHSEKSLTPQHWECLDGTLFIEDGKPYMVFCHEWMQVCNGTICYVELSKDLKKAVGNPKLLFSATDAPWVRPLKTPPKKLDFPCYVTDGPCFFKSKITGRLFMFWSSFGDNGYTLGLAESKNGRLDGEWFQHEKPFLAENGGHCGIFYDFDGILKMSLHRPNNSPDERMQIISVIEDENGIPCPQI